MKKSLALIFIGASFMALTAVGCSSKPSDEELQQLESLKAEVASLEKQIQSMESEKAALLSAIADKDARLAQCASDKASLQ